MTQKYMILPTDTWDVTLDALYWDNFFSPNEVRIEKPVETEEYTMPAPLPTRVYRKQTKVVVSIREPIFTPFDWLLGALEWLDEALVFAYEEQTGAPGGVGRAPARVDKSFLKRYREIRGWLAKLSKLLAQHRSAEYLVGSEQIGPIRVAMINDAARTMKFLAPKIRALAPADPKDPFDPMSESLRLASEIQTFLDRSRTRSTEGHYAKRDNPRSAKVKPSMFWRMFGWSGPPSS
jgi:hypothetical protein